MASTINDPLLKSINAQKNKVITLSEKDNANAYEQARKQVQDYLNQITATQKQNAEEKYKELERQAYIQKMQNQQNMPSLAAMSGITGGLSESAMLQPQLAYGNALNSINKTRTQGMNDIDIAANQQRASLEQDYADKIIAQKNLERQLSWNEAVQAANYGDYSKLRALGVNVDTSLLYGASSGSGTGRSGSSRGSSGNDDGISSETGEEYYQRIMSGNVKSGDEANARAFFLNQQASKPTAKSTYSGYDEINRNAYLNNANGVYRTINGTSFTKSGFDKAVKDGTIVLKKNPTTGITYYDFA